MWLLFDTGWVLLPSDNTGLVLRANLLHAGERHLGQEPSLYCCSCKAALVPFVASKVLADLKQAWNIALIVASNHTAADVFSWWCVRLCVCDVGGENEEMGLCFSPFRLL